MGNGRKTINELFSTRYPTTCFVLFFCLAPLPGCVAGRHIVSYYMAPVKQNLVCGKRRRVDSLFLSLSDDTFVLLCWVSAAPTKCFIDDYS